MPPILDNLPPEELHEVSWPCFRHNAFQKQHSVVTHQWQELFVFTHLRGKGADETEEVPGFSVAFSVKLFQLLGSNRTPLQHARGNSIKRSPKTKSYACACNLRLFIRYLLRTAGFAWRNSVLGRELFPISILKKGHTQL